MMLIAGQSNRIWHYWAGKYPGSVGLLISPSYLSKVPIDPWMPFVLDNGAFVSWRDNIPWNEQAWFDMLTKIRMRGLTPHWVAIPDAVGNRKQTLHNWPIFAPLVKAMGWKAGFCVQDYMTHCDVPEDADMIFVGGTDPWKFRNLKTWTINFPGKVHCARVNAIEMIETCELLGCASVDATGWFRDPSRPDKLPALERFIEGHRTRNFQTQLL